jgi:hypothetical protein
MAKMKKVATISIMILALFSISAVALVQLNSPKEFNYFKEIYNPLPLNLNGHVLTREGINSYISNLDKANLDLVVAFYSQFTNSQTISESIIRNALYYKMPINLAFALSYAESRFNPRAFNINSDGSIDRGLFQLNDSYRQDWKTKDFFNIEKNVREGIRYWSAECNKNERTVPITFIAYNMGPYSESARTSTIPLRRAGYIGDILAYEDMLNVEFNQFIKELE